MTVTNTAEEPHDWGPTRFLARRMVADRENNYCRCHVDPAQCGRHMLTATSRYDRRHQAYVLAAKVTHPVAADSGIVAEMAELFGRARR